MLKLRRDVETGPDLRTSLDRVLRFPAEAVRQLGRPPVAPAAAPLDRGSLDAARRVEDAMARVEAHFARLRLVAGVGDEDPDRPRAA